MKMLERILTRLFGTISFCCHSLKGLEYRVVILTGVNERNLPSKERDGFPFSGMEQLELNLNC